MSLEKGLKDYQRAGAPLLWRRTEGAGDVQPGEGKAPGRPYSSPPVPKGGLQKIWEGTLCHGVLIPWVGIR